ncbi:MAG: DUF2298 domain-containing protein [Lachnospiraceae bacterium]
MNSKKSITTKISLFTAMFLLVCIFDWRFMGSRDFSVMLIWWLALVIIGLIYQPITIILFHRFHDNGWMFSKTIGIAVSAWVLWFFSSFKLIKFTRLNCFIVLFVCFIINIIIYRLYTKYAHNAIRLREVYSVNRICSMYYAEIVFFCVFAIWCYLKGYNPKAYGTEKFMDYGFITAILKSEYMPAHDLWLSGENINYYYVGQYISAWLIRVSGVGAGYGYNLMLMTLAALGFSLPYSIVYNLMRINRREMSVSEKVELPEEKKNFVCVLAGALAGVSLSLAGNMHYPVYKWIMPKINRILGKEVSDYWFANATRYIGYNPDVDDKTIHEFPSYSFVLGDLHAHVINIMFVLTVVALLLAWIMNRKASMDIAKASGKPCGLSIVREVLSPQLLMCMFFIGLFHMTNYWDFPIYFVICGAVVLFSNLITYRYSKKAWILTAIQAVVFVIVWTVVALPFTLSFDSISTAIHLCTKHSALYQLLILWGLPAVIIVVFLITKIRKTIKLKKNIFDFVSTADLFACIMGLCGLGLVLLPEIVYVVDIYGDSYQRANTMFKLVYQAFMLFALVMPYIIVKFLYFEKSKGLKRFAVTMLVLLCMTFGYFFEACEDWFSGTYSTLDSSAFLSTEAPDDKLGVDWINENVPDDAVVLEMCGKSYTFFNRISVFTGNSTVLGWQTHEWLWRSSGDKEYPQVVSERHNDIITIYTSTNVKEVQLLIKKYGIDYIYVGEAELVDGYSAGSGSTAYNYHGSSCSKINVNHALLKSLGEVTVISESNEGKLYETYIVKVDKDKVIDEEIITNDGNTVTVKAENLPDRILDLDVNGDTVSYTEYQYDTQNRLVKEVTYDNNSAMTSYSEYSYEGSVPVFGEDLTASGERIGFWNYVEFDINGNVSVKHYFAADNSWVLTDNMSYDNSGCLVSEEFSYADGSSHSIKYSYDSDHKLMAKQIVDGETTTVYSYSYGGERIVSSDVYINGEHTGSQLYEYRK